jgi:hypothetical protein
MEIPALLHATALPSRLSTKQSSGVASPPRGRGKRTSLSRHVANTRLKFTVYDENKIAVSVIDKKSGDILSEIPHEKLQKLSEQMDEMIGKFFDQIA